MFKKWLTLAPLSFSRLNRNCSSAGITTYLAYKRILARQQQVWVPAKLMKYFGQNPALPAIDLSLMRYASIFGNGAGNNLHYDGKELDKLWKSTKEYFNVSACATAEQYNLENLVKSVTIQEQYSVKKFFNSDTIIVEPDVLYVTGGTAVGTPAAAEIFFFRAGSVVFWNSTEYEMNNILNCLRDFEKNAYQQRLVRSETETMNYTYIPQQVEDVKEKIVDVKGAEMQRAFFHRSKLFLVADEDNFFPKYTFSNAMIASIKLGIWERLLENYIGSICFLSDDLKQGRAIRITRDGIRQKTGELLALSHSISLNSELLHTPHFYWTRKEQATLYAQLCTHFNISPRTKMVIMKLNHCVKLAEIVSGNLNDANHVRLEYIIISLLAIEAFFAILFYLSDDKQDEGIYDFDSDEDAKDIDDPEAEADGDVQGMPNAKGAGPEADAESTLSF